MTALLTDILRGIGETLRETLPSDQAEAQVFLGAFWLTLAIEATAFTVLSLVPAIPSASLGINP
jgi:hypothetical protein